jgi:hypothetical protein
MPAPITIQSVSAGRPLIGASTQNMSRERLDRRRVTDEIDGRGAKPMASQNATSENAAVLIVTGGHPGSPRWREDTAAANQ